MSDETTREAPGASTPHDPSGPPTSGPDTGSDTSGPDSNGPDAAADARPDGASPTGGTGQPRRRRRGSRGGRNRKKPAGAGSAAPNGQTPVDASDDDDDDLPEHEHDPRADRGLTSEDIAADALEDAGLTTPTPMPTSEVSAGRAPAADPVRPKIGDSRPAPPAAAAAGAAGTTTNGAATNGAVTNGEAGPAKRRRRRGGRGRGRGGAGGQGADAQTTASGQGGRSGQGGGGRGPSTRDDVVRADTTFEDEPALTLDDDVLERRRGRTRKGRPAGRYMMVVHVLEGGHTHIAVLEGRNLVEHTLATPHGNDSIDGNIYQGRVQNVLPGMEAAFVDIGTPKNGVLYRGDVAFDKADVDGGGRPKIERMLKNGQTVLVQVTKNPIAHKGARLTQEVSLAGRFLVMVPGEPETYGISKRLPDDERKRLRRILDDLRPADAGLIVRTAAEGATRDELERDVRRLRSQWEQISQLAAKTKSAKLLYQEPDLVLRLIREEFTKEYRGIVIDDRALYESTMAYVEAMAPELAERVEYYDTEAEGLSIFERFHVSEQLLKALDRKVWLPSGGSLVIERTEALTVIDVNTGKNVGKSNLEETVFRNNLEAAEEVARQLRLRDIGGIIVIDFVDMEVKSNRDEVMKVFRDALARDKTRTQAFEMSELGLVEMTRKRISEGLVESFSETCQTCHGRGFVLDEALLRSVD
ncbi:MAG TPA: Rne/Rng family ribonuclease [Acidimicrobiia bacterium]|nr:Rne/Rng family ribonuclease [Acidimicrobiia bacterium]